MIKRLSRSVSVWFIVSLTASSTLAFEWRSIWENTWGYYLMSSKERKDHERAVRNLKTMAECEAYIKHLNRVIQERIDNRQIKPKRPIPVDLCGQLKAEGKIE
jgi:hypothetical protein